MILFEESEKFVYAHPFGCVAFDMERIASYIKSKGIDLIYFLKLIYLSILPYCPSEKNMYVTQVYDILFERSFPEISETQLELSIGDKARKL